MQIMIRMCRLMIPNRPVMICGIVACFAAYLLIDAFRPLPITGVTLLNLEKGALQELVLVGQIAGYDERTSKLFVLQNDVEDKVVGRPQRLVEVSLSKDRIEDKLGKAVLPDGIYASDSYIGKFCAFSPDFIKFAVFDVRGKALYVTDLAGDAGPKCVFQTRPGLDVSKCYVLEWLSGNRLLVCADDRNVGSKVSVMTLHLDTGVTQTLYEFDSSYNEQAVAFSRANSALAFIEKGPDSSKKTLRILELPSGKCREVASFKSGEPDSISALAWSGDGKTIACLKWTGKRDIVLIDAGSLAERVTFNLKSYVLYHPCRVLFMGSERLIIEYSSEGHGVMVDTYNCASGQRISSSQMGAGGVSRTVMSNLQTIAYGG